MSNLKRIAVRLTEAWRLHDSALEKASSAARIEELMQHLEGAIECDECLGTGICANPYAHPNDPNAEYQCPTCQSRNNC